MSIAKAFNDIAVAQGGTASTSGNIEDAAAAMASALGETFAGHEIMVETIDDGSQQTIEAAVALLGQHIGGGGGGKHRIKYATFDFDGTWTEVEGACCYESEIFDDGYLYYGWDEESDPITEASAGQIVSCVWETWLDGLGLDPQSYVYLFVGSDHVCATQLGNQAMNVFVMPDDDVWVVVQA